jgi:hypothetical protein
MAALGQAPAPAVPEEVQQTPIPGATPPAAGATTQQQQAAPGGTQPYSDPDKEARYQEWKRTHGG